jgi:hypothetical protein
MSDDLRNSLWNLFLGLYRPLDWPTVGEHVATFFRKGPVDELPWDENRIRNWVKDYFFGLLWYQVYDLVEFLVNSHTMMARADNGNGFARFARVDGLIAHLNAILERELSGFRFVQGTLVPISDPVEVSEIDRAAEASQSAGLLAHEHIRSAVHLLGKKPNPDYRNAVKEAISAVESVVKQLAGSESGTLDSALKTLSTKANLHGALVSGFSKLYGYTSDEHGIRHAMLDEPSVGFPEAKYMIVACSAFVNFLIAKADQAGLLK